MSGIFTAQTTPLWTGGGGDGSAGPYLYFQVATKCHTASKHHQHHHNQHHNQKVYEIGWRKYGTGWLVRLGWLARMACLVVQRVSVSVFVCVCVCVCVHMQYHTGEPNKKVEYFFLYKKSAANFTNEQKWREQAYLYPPIQSDKTQTWTTWHWCLKKSDVYQIAIWRHMYRYSLVTSKSVSSKQRQKNGLATNKLSSCWSDVKLINTIWGFWFLFQKHSLF